MLKKGQPVKFSRPVSTMRTVLSVVENGYMFKHDIISESGLKPGQVSSALYNLVFIGAVQRQTDGRGRSAYTVGGRHYGVAPCLRGISSIFLIDPFTKSDNCAVSMD